MSLCEDCAKAGVLKLRRQKDSNIAKACPDIKLYWDRKNKWNPDELTLHTTEKIYTHCPTCGRLLHRRATNTFQEIDGVWHVLQCQKCAATNANREKAMSTSGSVASECPEIKDWWDYEQNPISPDNLTRGSHYEAFLKCPACNANFKRDIHSFIAVHKDGNLRPVACPECGFSSKGDPEDNLVKICPDIVNWWDYEANKPFVPEQFSRGSQYRAHLKCPDCGLELYTGIHSLLHVGDDGNILISHAGRCRKYKAMASSNNLVTIYPQVKLWWDYDKNAPDLPEEYTVFSPKRIYFKCPDCGGETYRRIVDAFAPNSDGSPSLLTCPYCSEKRPLPGYNTIKVKHPDLINEEWSTVENILLGLDPDNILENSTEKAWWKCPICKHHYLMSIKDRLMKAKRKHSPCTFCSGRRILSPRIIL